MPSAAASGGVSCLEVVACQATCDCTVRLRRFRAVITVVRYNSCRAAVQSLATSSAFQCVLSVPTITAEVSSAFKVHLHTKPLPRVALHVLPACPDPDAGCGCCCQCPVCGRCEDQQQHPSAYQPMQFFCPCNPAYTAIVLQSDTLLDKHYDNELGAPKTLSVHGIAAAEAPARGSPQPGSTFQVSDILTNLVYVVCRMLSRTLWQACKLWTASCRHSTPCQLCAALCMTMLDQTWLRYEAFT